MGTNLPLLMVRREGVKTSALKHWRFVCEGSPFANGQEISGLQHLESCTGVLVGKISTLVMVRIEVVCNKWSQALEFGCVRLLPF